MSRDGGSPGRSCEELTRNSAKFEIEGSMKPGTKLLSAGVAKLPQRKNCFTTLWCGQLHAAQVMAAAPNDGLTDARRMHLILS